MKGEPRVVERLRAASRGDAAVPQPVIAEIAYGIERLPRSKRRESLQDRFDLVRTELGRVPWTDVVAHALAEGAVLVTANLAHMLRVPGLKVEDWATSEG